VGVIIKRKKCRHCGEETVAQRNTASNLIHFILTLLTSGLWLIIWLLAAAHAAGGWRCTKCGKSV
jgi:ribosomal protein S27AE